jgi:hypothetical protein
MVHVAHSGRAASARAAVSRFEVHADRCPQTLAKVIGTFANLDLVPREMRVRHSCGGLWIAIEADLEERAADRIAARLRALVSVSAVLLIPLPARAGV